MFIELKLNLVRRHCFLTHYFNDLPKGVFDTITIDIPIELGERTLPLEFLVIRRKELKNKMKAFSHLQDMVHNSNTKNYRPTDINNRNGYLIMSEHDEIANQLVDSKIGSLLLNCNDFLEELHVTDQKVYNNLNLMMKATLRIPANDSHNEQFHQWLQMIIYLTDVIANVRLSPTVAAKCDKSRKKQKQIEAKNKAEEIEEKKVDARREQEKIERQRLMRMTPSEQAKHEEKQKKKEQNRMKRKHVKV
jgi:hypothetical protein